MPKNVTEIFNPTVGNLDRRRAKGRKDWIRKEKFMGTWSFYGKGF